MNEQNPVLVTGATGNVGRQVVRELVRAGVPVRAVTRDPGTARMPGGVEVVSGDHTDPDSLRPHLDGVRAAFLVWPRLDDTAAAHEVVELLAKQVDRIVFLSSGAVRDGVAEQSEPIARPHRDIEVAIERSGARWTFLRPWSFAANTLEWADAVRTGGVVRGALGGNKVTLIDERDIAAVAVRALTEDGHAGTAYELTGPERLSPVEQVWSIGELIGKPLRWAELSDDEWHERLLDRGFDAESAKAFRESVREAVDTPQPITNAVQQVTGRPARTYREWLRWRAVEFTDPLPDIRNPGSGVVLMSTWTLDGPRRQRAAADAVLAAWSDSPWPQGLLRHSVFLGTDGKTVLHYSQWTDEDAVAASRDSDPPERVAHIDAEVPGIQRNGVTSYQLYRSVVPGGSLQPGCIVLVSFRTDTAETGRSFVDELLSWQESELDGGSAVGGMASNHFHVSTDGTSLVNYAEFEDEAAHQAVVESMLGGDDTVPRMIERTPGLTGLGFQRFLPYRGLTRH
ncbi:SDR family oxidoreductase [Saccharopolyspora taberi]|uniref:NAD(P)-binding domain-containing protein n=1 Tax=Saccharopolyspora taberi TaxID=60895 RepID=A0ABN3V504_9PSEU